MWFYATRDGRWEVYARVSAAPEAEEYVGTYNTYPEAVTAAAAYAKEHGLKLHGSH